MQDYTQNYPPDFAQDFEQNYTENTFTTNHLEEMNATDNSPTSGFNAVAVGPSNAFDDGEMDIDSALVSLGTEMVADITKNSSAITSYHNPSSETDNNGCRKSDHLWCCGRWFENKKGTYSFRKHLRTHNPELSCMAPIESCNKKFKMFSTIKELNKHYRSSHRLWADANGIPDPSCFCEACGTTFTRPDNRRRHLKNLNFSKCAETIEQMENNDF